MRQRKKVRFCADKLHVKGMLFNVICFEQNIISSKNEAEMMFVVIAVRNFSLL